MKLWLLLPLLIICSCAGTLELPEDEGPRPWATHERFEDEPVGGGTFH